MSALNAHVGYRVRIAQVRIFKDVYERMEQLGMTLGAFSALLVIRDNSGVRQGVLGAAMHIKRPNMTKLVNGLEKAGLVTRVTPPDDKRAVELRLTALGETRIAEAVRAVGAHDEEVSRLLGAHDRETLMRLLDRITEGLAAGRPSAGPDRAHET